MSQHVVRSATAENNNRERGYKQEESRERNRRRLRRTRKFFMKMFAKCDSMFLSPSCQYFLLCSGNKEGNIKSSTGAKSLNSLTYISLNGIKYCEI